MCLKLILQSFIPNKARLLVSKFEFHFLKLNYTYGKKLNPCARAQFLCLMDAMKLRFLNQAQPMCVFQIIIWTNLVYSLPNSNTHFVMLRFVLELWFSNQAQLVWVCQFVVWPNLVDLLLNFNTEFLYDVGCDETLILGSSSTYLCVPSSFMNKIFCTCGRILITIFLLLRFVLELRLWNQSSTHVHVP